MSDKVGRFLAKCLFGESMPSYPALSPAEQNPRQVSPDALRTLQCNFENPKPATKLLLAIKFLSAMCRLAASIDLL